MGEQDKNTALFGECKWTNEKVGLGVLETLIESSNLFAYQKKHFFLFSKSVFTKGCIEKAKLLGNALVSIALLQPLIDIARIPDFHYSGKDGLVSCRSRLFFIVIQRFLFQFIRLLIGFKPSVCQICNVGLHGLYFCHSSFLHSYHFFRLNADLRFVL